MARAQPDRRRTGKEGRVITGPRVLVIDGLSETEEVLKAVLEPRGLTVDRIRGNSFEKTAEQPPSVVVIHLDEPRQTAAASNGFSDVPQVIIGSAEISGCCGPAGAHQFLRKPFHYRELIQAIEGLLPERRPMAGG
jgi:DNA-binding response OmpR family regulator